MNWPSSAGGIALGDRVPAGQHGEPPGGGRLRGVLEHRRAVDEQVEAAGIVQRVQVLDHRELGRIPVAEVLVRRVGLHAGVDRPHPMGSQGPAHRTRLGGGVRERAQPSIGLAPAGRQQPLAEPVRVAPDVVEDVAPVAVGDGGRLTGVELPVVVVVGVDLEPRGGRGRSRRAPVGVEIEELRALGRARARRLTGAGDTTSFICDENSVAARECIQIESNAKQPSGNTDPNSASRSSAASPKRRVPIVEPPREAVVDLRRVHAPLRLHIGGDAPERLDRPVRSQPDTSRAP